MGNKRTFKDVRLQPCRFKLKDIPKKYNPDQVKQPVEKKKIKKIVQKVDENGTPLFKTIKIERKKGCGCGGKKKQIIIEEKTVPDTYEIWVEEDKVESLENVVEETFDYGNTVLCKLYGTVSESYCLKCKTYSK